MPVSSALSIICVMNNNNTKRAMEMRDRVVAEYSSLDRDDLRVIHCDLWHDNIKLHRGTLIPFDFEDTIIGFRLHDIAMAMLDLLEDTDDTRYPLLLESFRSGYESLLPWPDGVLAPHRNRPETSVSGPMRIGPIC